MPKRKASSGLHNKPTAKQGKAKQTPDDHARVSEDRDIGGDEPAEADDEYIDVGGGDDDEDGYAASKGAGQQHGGASGAPDATPPALSTPPRSIYKIPPYPQESRAMRVYAGPLRKWDRKQALVSTIYGPRADDINLFEDLRSRWRGCEYPSARCFLTPEQPDDLSDITIRGEVLESPWLPYGFEKDEHATYRAWYRQYRNKSSGATRHVFFGDTEELDEERASPFFPWNVSPTPNAGLDVLANSKPQVRFRPGDCAAFDHSRKITFGDYRCSRLKTAERGSPTGGFSQPDGFLFHAGGKALSLAWAPFPSNGNPLTDSLLAVAVVPQRDWDARNDMPETMTEQERVGREERLGSIQFWRMPLCQGTKRLADDIDRLPRLDRLCCFYWGWPKRMQWCPVQPPDNSPSDYSLPGMLAVLTEDGIVRVIKVQRSAGLFTKYEKITHPVATLDLLDEPNVYATCMTWAGVNRIAVGHTDGSITLWSVYPQMMLLRIPAHAAAVQDLCSAYPSKPFLVASRPVEGLTRLIDLTRPSNEHTFHPSPVAGVQANLLDWSEHMQGFASASPSNSPLNSKLDFMHYRHFPCPRRLFPSIRKSPPTCLAIGKVHPFALVGTADGLVWVCNMPDLVFRSYKSMETPAFVLQSEFKLPPEPRHPASIVAGAVSYRSGSEIDPTSAGQGFSRISVPHMANDADYDFAGPEEDDNGEYGEYRHRTEAGHEALGTVVHEELTAITAVAWNPCLDYGTWCAIGMASGLVLVKNLLSHASP